MVMAACATFSGAGCQSWAINVKNTFINFDPAAPAPATRSSRRSSSCPPPSRAVSCTGDAYWEEATRELCHAMALRRYDEVSKVGSVQASKAAAGQPSAKGSKNLDSLSEVSTTVSGDGSPRADSHSSDVRTLAQVQEAVHSWATVGSRKRPKRLVHNQTLAYVKEDYKPVKYDKSAYEKYTTTDYTTATPSTPSTCAPSTPASSAWATPTTSAGKKWWQPEAREGCSGSPDEAAPAAAAQQAAPQAQQARKYDGKGKGLSHFQRIEVGIDDDRDFRVVQRLIGPKGKHMSDITYSAKGAKVWIIGRGSRSWEDDEGPLVVCVGATSKATLDSALGAINDLLAKVRAEHKKYFAL